MTLRTKLQDILVAATLIAWGVCATAQMSKPEDKDGGQWLRVSVLSRYGVVSAVN